MKNHQTNNGKALYIRRPVIVKEIVTERLKDELIRLIDIDLDRLANGYELAKNELLSAENTALTNDYLKGMSNGNKLIILNQEYTKIKDNLNSKKQEIKEAELETLRPTMELESFIEINIGDNLKEKLRIGEIIIRDGILQEIIHNDMSETEMMLGTIPN